MVLTYIVFMLKKMKNNLFALNTKHGRLLYRMEGDGYCFYSEKLMKFYFFDQVTGGFLLEYFGVNITENLKVNIEKELSYDVTEVFGDIRSAYLKKVPKELLTL